MSNPIIPDPKPESPPYKVPPPDKARGQVWTYAQALILIQDSLIALSPGHDINIPFLEQWDKFHKLMLAEKRTDGLATD